MKLLFLALLSAANASDQCPAVLALRGVGADAAHQVQPYAHCLNGHIGTEVQLRGACADARGAATDANGGSSRHDQGARARAWLDAMLHWRADCETILKVSR